MACTSPLTGYKTPGGQITFKRQSVWGDLSPSAVPINCGQCINCKIRRGSEWKTRVTCEAQMHSTSCFITLTYDDEHLPSPPSLNVKHWQDFAKRARKKLGRFRFYHVGEYGERTHRAHYHAIMFGQDFRIDRVLHYSKAEHHYYRSELLNSLWKLGDCLITDFSEETASYVTGYITKKLNGAKAKERYQAIDPDTGECHTLRAPYSTMSRRPGIGKTWLDKYESDVYPHDFLVQSGNKLPPPKYFDSQIEPADLADLKLARIARAVRHQWNQTPERLEVRSKISRLRQQRKERELTINS